MASDFKYIIFSIFDISDFNEVTDVVKLIFKRELEKGIPLSIEDQSYYKNIKKRLNNSIIKEYLLKLGIDLCLIDSKISKGFVFIRKEW